MFKRIRKVVSQLFAPELHMIRQLKRRIFNRFPIELQLPITYKCNFDCIMCGMHGLINRQHFSVEEIGKILKDPLFQKIENVGINGGEPFLRNDLDDCIRIIIDSLPNLKGINIISNGFMTAVILEKLPIIKCLCEKKSIRLGISFSVDGVEDMQDFMRGRENAFAHVQKTCEAIKDNLSNYCDHLSAICTITKHNINRIGEVELWSEKNEIPVSYNIATVNRRINNEDRVDNFSVFSSEEARLLTQEFFYKQYLITKEEKYFGLFIFTNRRIRMAECPYMFNYGVTLTPDSQLGYCATHSKDLGSVLNESAGSIFRKNQEYHRELRKTYCEHCSHYIYELNYQGLKELRKEKMKLIHVDLVRKGIKKKLAK